VIFSNQKFSDSFCPSKKKKTEFPLEVNVCAHFRIHLARSRLFVGQIEQKFSDSFLEFFFTRHAHIDQKPEVKAV